MSDCEAVICQQEPIGAAPIAVEKLVTFSVAGPVSAAHGKVHIWEIRLPPALEVLVLLNLLLELVNFVALVLFPTNFKEFALNVPSCKYLILFQQLLYHIFLLSWLLFCFCHTPRLRWRGTTLRLRLAFLLFSFVRARAAFFFVVFVLLVCCAIVLTVPNLEEWVVLNFGECLLIYCLVSQCFCPDVVT